MQGTVAFLVRSILVISLHPMLFHIKVKNLMMNLVSSPNFLLSL